MKTIEELKSKFLIEVIEHGKAIAIGNHKGANKIHKELNLLYNKIKKEDRVDIFVEMLNSSDENVRLWAATFSLLCAPEKAEKVLRELANLSTITGLTAETTLNLWKQGLLNLL